jgi:hypothetical protein
MTQGTAFQNQPAGFHDSSSTTTPSYDFVARPKNVMPPANPTFAGRPIADQAKPLAQAFVPEKAPGLSRAQKALVAVPLVAVTAALAVFAGSFGLRTYQAHVRSEEIKNTRVAFPATIGGLTKRASAQGQANKLVSAVQTPTPPQGAGYVAAKSQVGVVFAGAYAMTDAEQQDYLVGASQAAETLGFTLLKTEAGPRGGQMLCGANPHKAQTFCAFVDVAAYGAMIVPGVGASGLATASTFRTAVEQRS